LSGGFVATCTVMLGGSAAAARDRGEDTLISVTRMCESWVQDLGRAGATTDAAPFAGTMPIPSRLFSASS
jgi:hypothetical protein